MEWEDICDPTGEIDFVLNWHEVSSMYTAQEIQNLITADGVIAMVKTINEHFWLTRDKKPLLLSHVNGRKAVVTR